MTSIAVDPNFDAQYYGYFVQAVEQRVGPNNVRFETLPLGQAGLRRDGLVYIVGDDEVRVYISAGDHPTFDLEALEWCDVYGKVNCDRSRVPRELVQKVLPIGPSFGIRAWSARRTIELAHATFSASGRRSGYRAHFAPYIIQYRRRLPLWAYRPVPSEPDYVFFTSWLWKKHPEANPMRAKFMRACREQGDLRFEGGFAPRRRRDVPGFEDISAPRRYPLREYLEKMGRSAFAFNSPAVHGCHGWKLGEFLALGKAIISTPLSWELPAPLVHGHHLHFVDGSDDAIREAILLLRSDGEYRRRLEKAARAYFDEHVSPTAVTDQLHAHGRSERARRG